ncbi:Protein INAPERTURATE POLLEN1 [Linum grandiflorum]
MRLIVPSFSERMKKAQSEFMRKIRAAEEKSDAVVGEAMKVEMNEMVSIFVDANHLRRSVISEIVGSLDLYQCALFLEGLTLFLAGFREPALVRKFKRN